MLLAAFLLLPVTIARAAEDEARLCELLQSPRTPPEQKDQICQKLRIAGTARCVPALAMLLADPALSQSARLALEPMLAHEAGQALRDALPKTTGVTRAGIIDSLGQRREPESIAAIAPLLKDPDALTAAAAARSLGNVGGPQAIESLRSARSAASPALQATLASALLNCADSLLATGDTSGAAAIFKELYDPAPNAAIKGAAYRGLVLTSGDAATAMIVRTLEANDPVTVKIALQLVRDIKGEPATRAFAELLPKLQPKAQIALLAELQQRGDRAAAPAIAAFAKTASVPVKPAALTALGALGDASHALFLVDIAARGDSPADQDAARQALALLRDPKLGETLVVSLATASPGVQGEIVRTLGQRQDSAAVPTLLTMAAGTDPATRLLALQSLSMLATAEDHKAIARLVMAAPNQPERDAAERALLAACLRSDKPQDAAPDLLECLQQAKSATDGVAARAALLRVVGRLGGEASLEALRAALADADASIQEAALRTMAEYSGLGAAGDLLKLSTDPRGSVAQRVVALRGYWRLVAAAHDRPATERWDMIQAGMKASERPEDKRLGLAELAKLPHPAALKFAQSLCADRAIGGEAETACVRIAAALLSTGAPEAQAALRNLEQNSKNSTVRDEAAQALDTLNRFAGYITTWSVSGPYRQAGKQCQELFDIAFAPENAAEKAVWKPLAPPADPALFWQADLLPTAGGDQCVVYVRSRVYCPKAQPVRLEIGSDDGNKIWINGALVHANNVMRPIAPADDRAKAELKEGWNNFLVKVTQNNMGCAVCIRILGNDGKLIDGLRFDAEVPAGK
jgi:HEAT repeat protein